MGHTLVETRPNCDRHLTEISIKLYVNRQLTETMSADTSVNNPYETHDPKS